MAFYDARMAWTRPDHRPPETWLDRPLPVGRGLALFAGIVIGVGIMVLFGQPQAPIEARALTQPSAPAHTQMRSAFRNCAAARAAGAAPVYRGDPGYGAHLDRDNDGVGCEPYRR